MGQYYFLCNLDKRQRLGLPLALFGSRFFSGQKLCEQLHNLGVKPFLALALVDLTAVDDTPNSMWGSWSGDRVVLIGDYSDDSPNFLTEDEKLDLKNKSTTLPSLVGTEFQDLSENPNEWIKNNHKLAELFPASYHVVVNLDKKEYLDPEMFGDDTSVDSFAMEKDGVMKGLYSCLFYSTGSGGGDIEALKKGRWAGDRLSIVEKDTLSADYRDISFYVESLLDRAEY